MNTVSKLSVSVEKESTSEDEVVKLSEMQPVMAGMRRAKKRAGRNMRRFFMQLKRPSANLYYEKCINFVVKRRKRSK